MYRAHRRIALMLIALVTLVTLPALPVGATTTFTDPQNRFSVDLPDGWQQDSTATNGGIIVQYLTTNPDGAFNVSATPLPNGTTIDAVPQLIIAGLSQQYQRLSANESRPSHRRGRAGERVGLHCDTQRRHPPGNFPDHGAAQRHPLPPDAGGPAGRHQCRRNGGNTDPALVAVAPVSERVHHRFRRGQWPTGGYGAPRTRRRRARCQRQPAPRPSTGAGRRAAHRGAHEGADHEISTDN